MSSFSWRLNRLELNDRSAIVSSRLSLHEDMFDLTELSSEEEDTDLEMARCPPKLSANKQSNFTVSSPHSSSALLMSILIRCTG